MQTEGYYGGAYEYADEDGCEDGDEDEGESEDGDRESGTGTDKDELIRANTVALSVASHRRPRARKHLLAPVVSLAW